MKTKSQPNAKKEKATNIKTYNRLKEIASYYQEDRYCQTINSEISERMPMVKHLVQLTNDFIASSKIPQASEFRAWEQICGLNEGFIVEQKTRQYNQGTLESEATFHHRYPKVVVSYNPKCRYANKIESAKELLDFLDSLEVSVEDASNGGTLFRWTKISSGAVNRITNANRRIQELEAELAKQKEIVENEQKFVDTAKEMINKLAVSES